MTGPNTAAGTAATPSISGTGATTGGTGPATVNSNAPIAGGIPTTDALGAPMIANAPPSTSVRRAGFDPNVIVPRSQMTEAQRAAADAYNAREVAKRDAIVAAYEEAINRIDETPVKSAPAPAQPAPTPSVFDEPAPEQSATNTEGT